MLGIHALLPDALWRVLLGAGMTRRPRSTVSMAQPEVKGQPHF
jgi:hypothetical protein